MISLRPHFSACRWLGLALAAEGLLMAAMARHGEFMRGGESVRFVTFAVSAGAAYWLAATAFARAYSPWMLWVAAIGLRLAILPVTPGDDLWRYRWEGRVQLHGVNPYVLAPDSPALSSLRDAEWPTINQRSFAAIYPPLAEGMFAGLAALRLPPLGDKVFFLLVDLGVLCGVQRLLAQHGKPAAWTAWYAWNPLAVYCAAGAAHFDVCMLAALVAAIWLLGRAVADGKWRPALASALLLGIAISFKAAPLALLPVWFFALGWRRGLVALPVAAVVSPLLGLVYGFPVVPIYDGLARFARDSRVNDAVWWLVEPLRHWTPDRAFNDLYPFTAALVCFGLAWQFRRDWPRALLWVMGATLLLSPLVHAWYVTWILPIAAWRGPAAQGWFVLSISMFGYFLLWEVNRVSGAGWREPLWLRLGIYLPPLVAGAVQLARKQRREAAVCR